MGYRSEVAYGIKVDDIVCNDEATEEEKNVSADGLFLIMLTEMQNDEIAGRCFDDTYDINVHLTVNKKQRNIIFYEGGLKWYDSYKDVQAHERLYEIMEEYAGLYYDRNNMTNPVSCAFIRLGEEPDDVEERGTGNDPWNIISINRCIDVHI